MFKKLTNGCIALVQKYLPDAFLFAVILSIIVFVLGIFMTGQTPMAMVQHWGNGFWSLLSFSMQMALVVVTGFVLADTKVVKRFLDKLAGIPKSPKGAIYMVSVVSLIAMFINWGFGLVVGPLFAKRLAKRVKGVDYRLLIATGYASIANWHGGISGSIPLKMASGGLEAETAGALTVAIPTSQTIFSHWNLIIQLAILIIIPLVNRAMHPDPEHTVEVDPRLLEDDVVIRKGKSEMTPAERMESSMVLSMIIGVGGLAYIIWHFTTKGFDLNLNIVNFIFLFSAILLHGNPKDFLDSINRAARGVGGVILQFPFYAGIMGMMIGKNAEGVSVAIIMSNAFVAISTPMTFPLYTYLSAGVVNFFVPSGGGQWAVQAPIMMPAGASLGVNPAITGMAIAWGDAWTNLIQPFWALPSLAIAGLGARDIMGYCIIDLFVVGVITVLGFIFLV
ncbi:MAG: short-chain fatty acid transporter [Clostridiales bacterium]|nr:short-chain fatty acid transporter [Clostridiales bacterium]